MWFQQHRIGIFQVAAQVESMKSDLVGKSDPLIPTRIIQGALNNTQATCVCMFQVSIKLTTAFGKVTLATYGRLTLAISGRAAS